MQTESLEDRYALAREQLFAALSQNTAATAILQAFEEAFSQYPDVTTHGAVLWSLMKKTMNSAVSGVSGEHFKVYLQYYYHYLAKRAQRNAVRRPLDITNLAFLTCVACFGYRRGCAEFDTALRNNNLPALNSLILTRENFLSFFWGDTLDAFSFLCCWRIINNLWDLWDTNEPVKILGFTSDALSFHLLGHHLKNPGAFLFRFSSQGGLSVDYIGRSNSGLIGSDGTFLKVLWKENAIPDLKSFMHELYEGQLSGSLGFLVDATDPRRVHRKQDVFSVAQFTSQLGTGAYNQVVGATEMLMEQPQAGQQQQEMSIYSRLLNFTDSGI